MMATTTTMAAATATVATAATATAETTTMAAVEKRWSGNSKSSSSSISNYDKIAHIGVGLVVVARRRTGGSRVSCYVSGNYWVRGKKVSASTKRNAGR